MTLIEAEDAFRSAPSPLSAGQLLAVAMEDESDEAISSETLLDIVAEVRDALLLMVTK